VRTLFEPRTLEQLYIVSEVLNIEQRVELRTTQYTSLLLKLRKLSSVGLLDISIPTKTSQKTSQGKIEKKSDY
jgi:uncharacterized protein HemY